MNLDAGDFQVHLGKDEPQVKLMLASAGMRLRQSLGDSPVSFTRTHAFDIIVVLAQSEFNLVGSPLYGVALKRHTVSEPQALERLRRDRPRQTRESRRDVPAARALRSDVVRRAASRGGTLRCAEARRVAYRDVDKSYASHRLS
jgi:hypothetical protein